MKVRFSAEIIDDNGERIRMPVAAEVEVPNIREYSNASEFYKLFDRYERPVIEARNQIASEITKDYLTEAAFFK